MSLDKVAAVIGSVCSGASKAVAPIYAQAEVLQITPSFSSTITDAGEFTFAANPGNAFVVKILYDYVAAKHKKLGVLTETTEYAHDLKTGLRSANENGRVELIEEDFLPSTVGPELGVILLRLKHANVDGIFINAQTEARFATIFKKIKELGWEVAVYGFYFGNSPTLLQLLGADLNGFVFGDWASSRDILTPEGRLLFDELSSKYGPRLSTTANSYIAIEAFRALSEALINSKQPKKYLLNNKFTGVFGEYSFSKNRRLIQLPAALKKVEGGKVITLKVEKAR